MGVFTKNKIICFIYFINVYGYEVNSDGVFYDPEASIATNQQALMKVIKHFKSCTKVTCGNFDDISKMTQVVHRNQNDINSLVNVMKESSSNMAEAIATLTVSIQQNTQDITYLRTAATRNQEDIGLLTAAVKEAFVNNQQLMKENQILMKENQELLKEMVRRNQEDDTQLKRNINAMVQRNMEDIHKLTSFLQPNAVGEHTEHRVVERASPHLDSRDEGLERSIFGAELPDCPSDYFELGGQCFRAYISNTVSWEAGRRICRQESADLAQPTDLRRLATYLSRNIRETWYWLGGQGDGTHARWISGELLSPDTPWASREPGDQVSTTQCLDLRASHNYPISGPLYANDCSGTSYVLCECGAACIRELNA